jgi:DNA polymerase V
MEEQDFDLLAKQISARCKKNTGISVSVGIAPTRTLAKIASKLCKQYPKLCGGCYMYRKEDIEKVLKKFPINDVWGIGRKMYAKLQDRGVNTAYDFTQMPHYLVQKMFGITGLRP